jgi:hypothetical protein
LSGFLDLLRPPPHRGPLIAAGAVLVTVGVALEELRLADKLPTGVHLVILVLAGGAIYALGVQVRQEGRPYAFQSVLLVCGLLLLAPALLTLADVLGADFDDEFPAGAVVWTSLVYAGLAFYPAASRNSAICALIAALAAGVALLAFVNWALDATSLTTYRWLLTLLALAYALVSLLLRGPAPRHSEQMVNAAGLAVLAIALTGVLPGALVFAVPFGGGPDELLPNSWELVVFAAGCGLVAYGAVDRAPGPAYLGVVNLAAFVASAAFGDSEETLIYWPALILALGLATMFAGLRPREPLPPEPNAYTTGKVPLASRSADEPVLRVRDDSPPL